MVLRKKVISILASLAVVVGLVLGGAIPANAASGSIRNTGPHTGRILNSGVEYTLPANGQAYYAAFYRVPQGFCSKSATLGTWCPTSNNVWRAVPAGQHTIQVLYIYNV